MTIEDELRPLVKAYWEKFTGRKLPEFHESGCRICAESETSKFTGYAEVGISFIDDPVCKDCSKKLRKLQKSFFVSGRTFFPGLLFEVARYYLKQNLQSLQMQKINIDSAYAEQLRILLDNNVISLNTLFDSRKNPTKN